MEPTNNEETMTDPEYMIWEANRCNDYCNSKAWILTALTMYPNDTSILLAAYTLERDVGKEREAAESLEALFQDERHYAAGQLQAEIDDFAANLEAPASLQARIFELLPPDVQRRILALGAERRRDDCRLLLVLLKRFPDAAATHAHTLVETLLRGEPEQCSKMLVDEALPFLVPPQSGELLVRVIARTVDYFNSQEPLADWRRMYEAIEPLAAQLGWDKELTSFANVRDGEAYVRKLAAHAQDEDPTQLVYCATAHLLKALHRYAQERQDRVLVEAFVEVDPTMQGGSDVEITGVAAAPFLIAVNCWELLNSNEILQREFSKLGDSLRLKPWTGEFIHEVALYNGRFDDASPIPEELSLASAIRRASVAYGRGEYAACLELALACVARGGAPEDDDGPNVTVPIVAGARRHVHFLPQTEAAVLFYCAKLALRSIEYAGNVTDLAAGNMIVLLQLGWPQELPLLQRILDAVRQSGVFHYPLFQSYIINIEVLEEFAFLCTEQGGNVTLDIMPNAQQHLGQRRIGTRGADRGAKDDVRKIIRGQLPRCDDSVPELVARFMTQERQLILQGQV